MTTTERYDVVGVGACGLIGLGAAVIWPAQDALLARLAAGRRRTAALGVAAAGLA